MDTGNLTQAHLDQMAPPSVHTGMPDGTNSAFEYIRDVLINTRQVVSSLYLDLLVTRKRLSGLEEIIAAHTGNTPDPIEATNIGGLTMDDLKDFLEELTPEDD